MIDIAIPGFGELHLSHLVLDYNGTLAVDGQLVGGVRVRLESLSRQLTLHVVTADTFGNVQNQLHGLPVSVHILPPGHQDQSKRDYLRRLGAAESAAIGNGRNDLLMLQEAALGIGVILAEGAWSATLAAADVVCNSILDALDLLSNPLRLTAALRA
jgi:soluble P-type ATPase